MNVKRNCDPYTNKTINPMFNGSIGYWSLSGRDLRSLFLRISDLIGGQLGILQHALPMTNRARLEYSIIQLYNKVEVSRDGGRDAAG
jgi:hypothetical protein